MKMKQLKQLLFLAICCLAAGVLKAQTISITSSAQECVRYIESATKTIKGKETAGIRTIEITFFPFTLCHAA